MENEQHPLADFMEELQQDPKTPIEIEEIFKKDDGLEQ